MEEANIYENLRTNKNKKLFNVKWYKQANENMGFSGKAAS